MKDLSVLVIDQGTIIDRIDFNIQNVAASVEEGYKQLQRAERTQKKGGMVTCATGLEFNSTIGRATKETGVERGGERERNVLVSSTRSFSSSPRSKNRFFAYFSRFQRMEFFFGSFLGESSGLRNRLLIRIFRSARSFETSMKLLTFPSPRLFLSLLVERRAQSLKMHVPQFNPLAAKAATISLSAFGGPFGFNFFSDKWKKLNKKSSKQDQRSQKGGGDSSHEALSNEWLETGQCPIAKSYRAVSGVLPLVAKALQPPPGMKLKCPPAVVAARAALARTAFIKNLRPQPLPAKVLAIGLLGMAANIPLGVWREHTEKFSPQWFAAVHAAVPFIAMLRKLSGRGRAAEAEGQSCRKNLHLCSRSFYITKGGGHCGDGEVKVWDPLTMKVANSGYSASASAAAPTAAAANVCF
uniref:t-SNARE coiled-coil homology domain-containing protein n=1 Tax=Ananas comosus var. bracteatus TaxID=296719 RepID=A0A6V7PJE0_ANACO|nr:unnamed protein product [Ananas comosus var. bracteatus]